jgi:hypothetical protein
MFNAMHQAFASVQFEPSNHIEYLVRTFLVRFDAIFTLNRDLLLERHYLNENIGLASPRRWSGWQLPGTKPFGPTQHDHNPILAKTAMRAPEDQSNFKEQPCLQPYYKLHGSTNWTGGGGRGGRLIIMGEIKPLRSTSIHF